MVRVRMNQSFPSLPPGFPTTFREKTEFDARQESNLEKLAKEMLGKVGGGGGGNVLMVGCGVGQKEGCGEGAEEWTVSLRQHQEVQEMLRTNLDKTKILIIFYPLFTQPQSKPQSIHLTLTRAELPLNKGSTKDQKRIKASVEEEWRERLNHRKWHGEKQPRNTPTQPWTA